MSTEILYTLKALYNIWFKRREKQDTTWPTVGNFFVGWRGDSQARHLEQQYPSTLER